MSLIVLRKLAKIAKIGKDHNIYPCTYILESVLVVFLNSFAIAKPKINIINCLTFKFWAHFCRHFKSMYKNITSQNVRCLGNFIVHNLKVCQMSVDYGEHWVFKYFLYTCYRFFKKLGHFQVKKIDSIHVVHICYICRMQFSEKNMQSDT
jgi:hypothetical protein